MKAAFAFLEGRIAPVFDTARQVHVVIAEKGLILSETEEILLPELPQQNALRLGDLGIETLVCGAISWSLRQFVAAFGIHVIPFVAGDLHEVVQAWLKGKLEHDTYLMPGCRGRGQHHSSRSILKEEQAMNGRGRRGGGQGAGPGQGGRRGQGGGLGSGQSGMGQGAGQGLGQTGPGRAPIAGPGIGGSTNECLCPGCGHREPHERHMPCIQKLCPKCGTAMTRG